MFDRIAPTYDKLNTILSFSIDRFWRKKAIRELDLWPDNLILDVATGTGDLAFEALQHDIRIIGIDLSKEMLRQASGKGASQIRLGRYLPTAANALEMPFGDNIFDRAMVAFGIRNMERPEAFLQEAARVLKKHGKLAVLEFSLPSSFVVRAGYLLYFTKILPTVGGMVSGDYEAYRYLRDSVMNFPPPAKLEHLIRNCGFHIAYSKPLFFGIAHLYVMENLK